MMRMAVKRIKNDMYVLYINAQRRSSARPVYLNTVASFNIFSSILAGVVGTTSISRSCEGRVHYKAWDRHRLERCASL
jgi:hypothetical protein